MEVSIQATTMNDLKKSINLISHYIQFHSGGKKELKFESKIVLFFCLKFNSYIKTVNKLKLVK